MRNRTLARQLALQFLYMYAIRQEDALADLDDFLLKQSKKSEVRSFARRLIDGTIQNLSVIDDHITVVADNWHLERMAYIDLGILRMATFELLMTEDIPPIVSINEAIELAKIFSTDKSSAFVNGILDKIKMQLSTKKKDGLSDKTMKSGQS